MSELSQSFGGVAEAYEYGRPRYAPRVMAEIAAAAGGGPRLLDVGAGTGRLSAPLVQGGFDVVAVEPLDSMLAVLARNIGSERALSGHAEALPLGDGSVDGAVCSDAWHWFDGARAADELHRVVRSGGGAVICILKLDEAHRPPWADDTDAVMRPLWEAVHHPFRDGSRRPVGLDGHPGFEPLRTRYVPFVHATDRRRILAHYQSMSAVASLDADRRAEVLGDLDAVLRRHRVERVEIPQRAELWITRRRPGPALRAGRPAAAS